VGRLQQVSTPGHGAGDQRFQALLAGIGGHGAGGCVWLGASLGHAMGWPWAGGVQILCYRTAVETALGDLP
jgi:hypothetical protein